MKPKHQLNKPKTNVKKTIQVKRRILQKTLINSSATKSKISKTPVEVKDKTVRQKQKRKYEGIFKLTGCISCEEGRQREVDERCWGYRLRRLQNIQES